MKPMTDEEYVNGAGLTCPICRKVGDISSDGNVEIVGWDATQEVHCANCGSYWYDLYKLTGYKIIEQGETGD